MRNSPPVHKSRHSWPPPTRWHRGAFRRRDRRDDRAAAATDERDVTAVRRSAGPRLRPGLAARLANARPYDLQHSFASLLLHEGRSVIYVARQLGHDARLTLTRYGHVIDELEDAPRLEAESAIANARLAVRATDPRLMREFGQ